MRGHAFLRSMSTFECVLFHADVDKAAEELNVSIVTIFEILEELEKSIGVVLVDWNGGNPSPTEAGITLQKAIEAGKTLMADAMMDPLKETEDNKISMSCTEAFATFLWIPT